MFGAYLRELHICVSCVFCDSVLNLQTKYKMKQISVAALSHMTCRQAAMCFSKLTAAWLINVLFTSVDLISATLQYDLKWIIALCN